MCINTSDPCTIKRTSFKVKRSKVKVTGLINNHTVNAQYLPNGKDAAQIRPVSPTSAMTSKVKGQGRKIT